MPRRIGPALWTGALHYRPAISISLIQATSAILLQGAAHVAAPCCFIQRSCHGPFRISAPNHRRSSTESACGRSSVAEEDSMSTQLDPHQPPIDVRTLGRFEVLVHGVQKAWKGKNAGTQQLRRVFGYLVFRRDHPVERAVLARVAGGHGDGDRRYVIADVKRIVMDWGLDVALRVQRSHVTLLRHPGWNTDTDRLGALFGEAQAISEAGRQGEGVRVLEGPGRA